MRENLAKAVFFGGARLAVQMRVVRVLGGICFGIVKLVLSQ